MPISLPKNMMDYSWEMQPGESKGAFERFEEYRDLGPGRTLAQVAKKFGVQISSLPSSPNKWVERCRAYDKWVRVQVATGMKHATTYRDRMRLKVFKKAIGCSEAAVDTLWEVMTDPNSPAAARVRAAGKMLDVVGYEPPSTPSEAAAMLDPAIKAKMLDALEPAERAMLQELTAKMRQAAARYEQAVEHAQRYPGLVPGAGQAAAAQARADQGTQRRQARLSAEIEAGQGVGPRGRH